MSNSTQRKLGYRDVVYNINAKRFFQYEAGDNYKELEVEALGILSGSTADRPSSPNIGDLYWDTNVDALIVYNGSSWELVGGSGSGSGYWTKNGTDLIPLNTGDDVIIGDNKIELKSTGEAYFVSDVALGNQNPASRLSINVLTKGTDGIDFTNSGGNNIYAGIKCQASGNALYFENRSAGKTLYIEGDGDVKIGGSLPSSPTIHLYNSGAATLTGLITVNRALSNNPAFVARLAGVEKAKIRADGQALFSGPISIGGFASINEIEKYENGSFTPTYEFSTSGSVTTYQTQQGYYSIIGNIVTINIALATKVLSSPVGSIEIGGLPAPLSTAGNSPQFFGKGKVLRTNVSNSNKAIYIIGSGSGNANLLLYTDPDYLTRWQGSDLHTGNNKNNLTLSMTYRTD